MTRSGPEPADNPGSDASAVEERRRLSEAQRISRIGSWEWDIPSDTIRWSDELYRLYGLEPGSIEPDFETYIGMIHEEDRGLAKSIVEKAREDHKPFQFEHRVVHPDGTVRWLLGHGTTVLGDDGEPVRMHGTSQDITEIKQSQNKFEALLESAPDAMVITDEGGGIVLMNKAAEQLFGYGREELIGQSIETLVPQRLRNRHRGHRDRFHRDPHSRPMGQDMDLAAVRKDGTEFPVEVSLSPIRTPDGLLVTAAIRDISDRMAAEKADRTARQRLEEIQRLRERDQMKTNLLNTAAHELNTPLTPIRLQLHLLSSGALGEMADKQARALEILNRNTERLGSIITDFLDVARLESGRMAYEPEPVDLSEAVQDVVESFQEPADRVGVEMVTDTSEGLVVKADPHRFGQVLYNLVSNAIKFTPEGGTVTITAKSVDDMVRVSVTDTGLGLTPEQMEKMFQPFTQVHDKSSVQTGGTGLGLYISRGIVDAHGGTLVVESDGPGKGSTFRFDLRAAEGGEPMKKKRDKGRIPEPESPIKKKMRRPPQDDRLAKRLRELI